MESVTESGINKPKAHYITLCPMVGTEAQLAFRNQTMSSLVCVCACECACVHARVRTHTPVCLSSCFKVAAASSRREGETNRVKGKR